MVENKLEIPWEVADGIALTILKAHYAIVDSTFSDAKLKKALKRVIEYYRGGVENE